MRAKDIVGCGVSRPHEVISQETTTLELARLQGVGEPARASVSPGRIHRIWSRPAQPNECGMLVLDAFRGKGHCERLAAELRVMTRTQVHEEFGVVPVKPTRPLLWPNMEPRTLRPSSARAVHHVDGSRLIAIDDRSRIANCR